MTFKKINQIYCQNCVLFRVLLSKVIKVDKTLKYSINQLFQDRASHYQGGSLGGSSYFLHNKAKRHKNKKYVEV